MGYIPGSATRKRAVENTAEKATIVDGNTLAVSKTWQRARKSGVVQGRVVNEDLASILYDRAILINTCDLECRAQPFGRHHLFECLMGAHHPAESERFGSTDCCPA